jgi:hypothetical protein
MRVISFYTPDGVYGEFAKKLRASLERFNLPHHLEELPSAGSWLRNLYMKPQWIFERLMQFQEPVLWLDADCEVMQPPVLFDEPGYDFQIYNLYADPTNGQVSLYDPARLLSSSGVMYVGFTPAAIDLMRSWAEACKKVTLVQDTRDDQILDKCWTNRRFKGDKKRDLRSRWLPKPYNRMDCFWPSVEPVINHVYRDGRLYSAALAKQHEAGQSPQA